MAITTVADLNTALAANQSFMRTFHKLMGAVNTSYRNFSTYAIGQVPPAGTVASGAHTNDPATPWFPNVSTKKQYLYSLAVSGTSGSDTHVLIVDRLVTLAAVSCTTTGAKSVNTTTLPRYTGGVGVMAYLEVTTAGTTTTAVVNLSKYTNQSGTANQVGGSYTFTGATASVGWLTMALPLAAGDSGVKSVEELTVTTAATNLVVAVVLARPLARIFVPSNSANVTGYFHERPLLFATQQMPRIYDGCSPMMVICGATASQNHLCVMRSVYA